MGKTGNKFIASQSFLSSDVEFKNHRTRVSATRYGPQSSLPARSVESCSIPSISGWKCFIVIHSSRRTFRIISYGIKYRFRRIRFHYIMSVALVSSVCTSTALKSGSPDKRKLDNSKERWGIFDLRSTSPARRAKQVKRNETKRDEGEGRGALKNAERGCCCAIFYPSRPSSSHPSPPRRV